NSRKGHRGGVRQKLKSGGLNPRREEAMAARTFASGNVVKSSSFSLLHDASFSPRAWQGQAPPEIARESIRALYHSKPDAEGLYPWLRTFFPIPYIMPKGPDEKRGTFVVDKNGLIFFYRSYRAEWLAGMVDQIEEAQRALVGDDLLSLSLRNACADGVRGPHLAIIIGHQRQSSVEPYLTAWHRAHQDRVDKFMELDVIKRIIRWVCGIVRAVWPGLAARFEKDAEWHYKKYGIRPLFGYFWNFCWNAAFPGDARIHTPPHADSKNQVGVCLILCYVLKCVDFNHKTRSWLVLWEADIAAELPPWTLTGYPSSLFYHFNVDVHRLRHVWTPSDVDIPTPENSHPVVPGDDTGRGSMVFFSQASMRHGPETGSHTLEMAINAGHSGSVDRNLTVREAFQRARIDIPIPPDIIARFGEGASHFGR
ncbi:hypothetical protein C8F04DRAFT_952465, partial [Mycena alexandri]